MPAAMKVEWDDEADSYALQRSQTLERQKTLPLVNGQAEAREERGWRINFGLDGAMDEDEDVKDQKPTRRSSKREGRGSVRGRGRGSKRAKQ